MKNKKLVINLIIGLHKIREALDYSPACRQTLYVKSSLKIFFKLHMEPQVDVSLYQLNDGFHHI